MAETIEAFGVRLGRLLAKQGCKNVALSWSSDGKFQVTCYLRFLGRDGLEQATSFDWPPARGAVDNLMSQVVGYPVTVDREGKEVHAIPAVPDVDPPKFGYPTMGGYIAQCETCDEPSDRARVEDARPAPWRYGLCVKCLRAQLAAEEKLPRASAAPPQQTWETSARLLGDLEVARQQIRLLAEQCHKLNVELQKDAEVITSMSKTISDLTDKLADTKLRALANSQVAGITLPADALRRGPERYVCPIDDVDLLPDA